MSHLNELSKLQLIMKVVHLEKQLAECYRLTGADPDGNEDWRLAEQAVSEVKRLREEFDELENKFDNSCILTASINRRKKNV